MSSISLTERDFTSSLTNRQSAVIHTTDIILVKKKLVDKIKILDRLCNCKTREALVKETYPENSIIIKGCFSNIYWT